MCLTADALPRTSVAGVHLCEVWGPAGISSPLRKGPGAVPGSCCYGPGTWPTTGQSAVPWTPLQPGPGIPLAVGWCLHDLGVWRLSLSLQGCYLVFSPFPLEAGAGRARIERSNSRVHFQHGAISRVHLVQILAHSIYFIVDSAIPVLICSATFNNCYCPPGLPWWLSGKESACQ